MKDDQLLSSRGIGQKLPWTRKERKQAHEKGTTASSFFGTGIASRFMMNYYAFKIVVETRWNGIENLSWCFLINLMFFWKLFDLLSVGILWVGSPEFRVSAFYLASCSASSLTSTFCSMFWDSEGQTEIFGFWITSKQRCFPCYFDENRSFNVGEVTSPVIK